MLKFSNHNKQNKSGFTVIELLIGIFIFLLVSELIYLFQKNVYSLNGILSDSISGQEQARKALKIMSAEIRSASPSSLGSYQISQAGNFSLTFYCDIDNDDLKERIRYFLDGTTLKKGIIEPSGSPIDYSSTEQITNFIRDVENGGAAIFSYYDKNYDGTTLPLAVPLADISAVRLIKIDVAIDKDVSELPGPMTITTQVSIRSLRASDSL